MSEQTGPKNNAGWATIVLGIAYYLAMAMLLAFALKWLGYGT